MSGKAGGHDEAVQEQTLAKARRVPGIRGLLRVAIFVHQAPDGVLDHLPPLALQILPTLQGEEAEVVDDLSLLVHDLVVVQQALPGLEVVPLHPLLGLADGLGHQTMGDDLPFLDPPFLHSPGYPVGHEKTHEVVFQGEEELGGAGVALAARSPAELAVDAPGLVAL